MASAPEPIASLQLAFEGDEAGLDQLHQALEQVWQTIAQQRASDVDSRWRAMFSTAIAEVAANIIEHAIAPGMPARIDARLDVLPRELRALFRDRGRPNDASAATGATMPADLGQESGRGLAIIRLAVDCVRYERVDGENRWELTKRF